MTGRPLEVGMLLLTDDRRFPKLYTVAKVNKTNARLICHHETMSEDATLSAPRLPDGWTVVPNRALAGLVHTVADLERATRPAAEPEEGN